jgi:hypothetical protein
MNNQVCSRQDRVGLAYNYYQHQNPFAGETDTSDGIPTPV